MQRGASLLAASALAALVASGAWAQAGTGGTSGTGSTGRTESGMSGTSSGSRTSGQHGSGKTGAHETGKYGKSAKHQAPQQLTVVRVDESNRQIVARGTSGPEKTIVLDRNAKIERKGETAAMDLGDLKPGDRIAVSGSMQKGHLKAENVEVMAKETGTQPGHDVSAPPPRSGMTGKESQPRTGATAPETR